MTDEVRACRACAEPAHGRLPTCMGCWVRMPVKLRVRYIAARGQTDRRRDAAAGILQWCIEQKAGK